MSKTRDTGNIGNIVKVDTSGNVSFVSGSTTLATINTSGQLSGSSPVLSASYASNAELLDGLDSTVFTLTSSFNAQTASFTAFSASILTYTSSANNRFSSIETVTGSNITRLSALESYTSSLNNKTASFATTGSNTFTGIQTVNSNLIVTGSITAQTLIVQTVTSSIIYSSGSNIFGNAIGNTQTFTGSVLVTGSGTFASSVTANGGLIIAGSPTGYPLGELQFSLTGNNSYSGISTLGTGTTTLYFDHRATSNTGNFVFRNGTGAANTLLTIAGSGAATFSGSVTAAGGFISSANSTQLTITNTEAWANTSIAEIRSHNVIGVTQIRSGTTNGFYIGAIVGNNIGLQAADQSNNSVSISLNPFGGNVGIGTSSPCSVLHVYGANPSLIVQNSNTATVGNAANIFFRNLLSTGAIHYAGYIAGIQQSTSANTGDLSFNTYNNGSVVEGLRISAAGVSCFSGAVCTTTLRATSVDISAGTSAAFSLGVDQQSTFAFGSTNGKRVAIIRDSTCADNGLQFGYDVVDKTGIIAGSATAAGVGIDFYTYNGSAWANRMRITKDGIACFNSTVCAPTFAGSTVRSTSNLDLNGNSGYLTLRTGDVTRLFVGSTGGVSVGAVTDPGVNNLIVAGTICSGGITQAQALIFSAAICGSGTKLGTGGANTGYTSDGIWGGTATPNYISTAQGGTFRLGYTDNGSGLYGSAYGFDVSYKDGLNRCIDYDAIMMRNAGQGTIPFRVTSYGNIYGVSKNFRIKHPISSMNDTHYLIHTSIEGPQADLIYRGKVQLVNGKAEVNIDLASRMTDGTFEALCQDVQSYTTNESGWSLTKSYVVENILHIEAQDETSDDTISWLVIGERNDDGIKNSAITDENGHVIVEELKPEEGL
jgi:hypothetical protein